MLSHVVGLRAARGEHASCGAASGVAATEQPQNAAQPAHPPWRGCRRELRRETRIMLGQCVLEVGEYPLFTLGQSHPTHLFSEPNAASDARWLTVTITPKSGRGRHSRQRSALTGPRNRTRRNLNPGAATWRVSANC